MKRFLWISLALCASCSLPMSTHAEGPPAATHGADIDLSTFKMTFNDEFDGVTLDETKWQAPEMPRQGASRWVKSLVTVKDGMLHLGIRLTDDPVFRYDCGAVRTQKDYDPKQTMFWQTYGYFETRCKLPKHLGADYFADFWMMCGKVGDDNPDTRLGVEVDIFETFYLGYKDSIPLSFHWNGYGKHHNVASVYGKSAPHIKDGQFHTYGLYWDEKIYVWYIDGVEIGRTDLIGLGSGKDGKTYSKGPCQKPGYLKLTVEAAPWAGSTSEGWEKEMPKEDEFVIDYVRAYEGKLSRPGLQKK